MILPVRARTKAAASADYFMFIEPEELPEPARLGVHIRDDQQRPGVLVVDLKPHGPAARAGPIEEIHPAGGPGRPNPTRRRRSSASALLYQEQGDKITLGLYRPMGAEEEQAQMLQPARELRPEEFIELTVEL
ncbi:MAG: hypothetical protein U5J62_04835 [Desulfurivibrio sp.]|nr:hypothetical protein [Desulfurivibrio sp.]